MSSKTKSKFADLEFMTDSSEDESLKISSNTDPATQHALTTTSPFNADISDIGK